MCSDLVVNEKHGYKLSQLYAGDPRGKIVQVTPLVEELPENAHLVRVRLSPEGLHALAADIYRLGDNPTPEEMGATLMEMEEMLAERDGMLSSLREGEKKLHDRIAELEEALQKQARELDGQKAIANEMFEEAKRAQKEANETRAELREINKERIKSRERSEVLGKELDHAREERGKVERDLSRALGYIDRIVEDEPPMKNPVTMVHRSAGEASESFVSGGGRGPVLGDYPWR